jgi:hypothetical protein
LQLLHDAEQLEYLLEQGLLPSPMDSANDTDADTDTEKDERIRKEYAKTAKLLRALGSKMAARADGRWDRCEPAALSPPSHLRSCAPCLPSPSARPSPF